MRKLENSSGKSLRLFCLLAFVLTMLTACQKEEGEQQMTEEMQLLEKDDILLKDKTPVSKWTSENNTGYLYQLEDGTPLLETIESKSPETVQMSDLEGYEHLEPEAQEAVRRFYKEAGDLYDLEALLEEAYTDYRTCLKDGEKFQTHLVSQETSPTAETDRYVAYLTTISVPAAPHYDGTRIQRMDSRIFDRRTGEEIDVWELFLRDRESVESYFAELCQESDSTVTREDMEAVIGQASYLWYMDHMELWFTVGTWENQEFDKAFGFKYNKIEEILQPWAIPDSP